MELGQELILAWSDLHSRLNNVGRGRSAGRSLRSIQTRGSVSSGQTRQTRVSLESSESGGSRLSRGSDGSRLSGEARQASVSYKGSISLVLELLTHP